MSYPASIENTHPLIWIEAGAGVAPQAADGLKLAAGQRGASCVGAGVDGSLGAGRACWHRVGDIDDVPLLAVERGVSPAVAGYKLAETSYDSKLRTQNLPVVV